MSSRAVAWLYRNCNALGTPQTIGEIVDAVRGDDLSLADDDHLFADLLDFRQDVRAENDGVVAGQALDQRRAFP